MRGRRNKIGDTRMSPNGYEYTRTESGWVTTHRIVVEKKIGRSLKPNERVRFVDNDRTNLDPGNLEVYVVKTGSKARKIAHLRARIADLQSQLEELENSNGQVS